MKRILLLSLIVLATVMILPSCNSGATPVTTPTPTVAAPKYTSAEAIALVKNYLYSRAKTVRAVQYVSALNLVTGSYDNGVWTIHGFKLYETSGTVVPYTSLGSGILQYIERYNNT